MKSFWTWLKPDLRKLAATEPARLNGRYAQIVSVLAAAGVTIPHLVDYRVGVALAVWGIVAPWLQGKKTRADVWSPQTVQDLTDLAHEFPGLAHSAESLLAAGWDKWSAFMNLGKGSSSPAPVTDAQPPQPATPAALADLDQPAAERSQMGEAAGPLPIEAEAQAAAAAQTPTA